MPPYQARVSRRTNSRSASGSPSSPQGQSIGTRQSGIANRAARTALPSWASVTDTPQRSAASAMEKLIS